MMEKKVKVRRMATAQQKDDAGPDRDESASEGDHTGWGSVDADDREGSRSEEYVNEKPAHA